MKKRNQLKKFLPYAVSACMLTAFIGCAGDTGNSGSDPRQEEEQQDEGVYQAVLTPLNSSASLVATTGTANIIIEGDEVKVSMTVNGAPANITHIQHIHAGSSCPTLADDVNADTYIDVIEGVPKYGPILIPLDGDLSSQDAGAAGFPNANSSGNYPYNETTSLTSMLADLRAPDPDPTDATIKLEGGELLNLAGRHIVIHGVLPSSNLPDTVASIGNIPSHVTLPIACGVITRVAGGGTTGGTTGGTSGGTTGGTSGGTTGGTTGGTSGGTTGGGTTGIIEN
jgi:hypothetical protein